MLLQIHRRGESYLDVFAVEMASVVITTLFGTVTWRGALYSHFPWRSLRARSDSQHPVQCVRLLQPNDSDLTGFRKPTSIFFEHFLCCVHRQTICLGGGGVQIKACYPLLRGRLHIMMKGLALSSCERITRCCSGRKFLFLPPPPPHFLIVSLHQI